MSYFAAKLAGLLESKKMRASELSRISDINDALISRWINGQQKFVSNGDLAALCASISSDPRDRAELIRAHLLDEMAGPGSELIEIHIKGQSAQELKDDRILYRAGALPLKLMRAFEILAREAITDADVRAVILGLANVVEPASSSPQEEEAGKQIAGSLAREASRKNTRPKP